MEPELKERVMWAVRLLVELTGDSRALQLRNEIANMPLNTPVAVVEASTGGTLYGRNLQGITKVPIGSKLYIKS
jgi:hypothetical protein